MGYTSISMDQVGRSTEEIKEFLVREWEGSGHYKVIECSKVGNIVYQAVKSLENGEVFASVTITSFEQGEFFWKVITEDMGPVYYNCPQKILNNLSPTKNKYALSWRAKCENVAISKRAKFTDGDILLFEEEISFPNGYKSDKFVLCKDGRIELFSKYTKGIKLKQPEFRITKWKELKFTIVGNINNQ